MTQARLSPLGCLFYMKHEVFFRIVRMFAPATPFVILRLWDERLRYGMEFSIPWDCVARDLSLSVRAVRRETDRLRELGLLRIVADGSGDSKQYSFNLEALYRLFADSNEEALAEPTPEILAGDFVSALLWDIPKYPKLTTVEVEQYLAKWEGNFASSAHCSAYSETERMEVAHWAFINSFECEDIDLNSSAFAEYYHKFSDDDFKRFYDRFNRAKRILKILSEDDDDDDEFED